MPGSSKFDIFLDELNSLEKQIYIFVHKVKELEEEKNALSKKVKKLLNENEILTMRIEEISGNISKAVNLADEINLKKINWENKEELKSKIEELISKINYHIRS